MTINGNSMMASQVYSNKNVQSQSGASGYATQGSTDAMPSFDAIAQQLLSALDTNKSGSIDKTEFSQAAQALSNNTTNSSNVDTAFSKIDQNGDGQISSDEFLNAIKEASTQKHQHRNTAASPSDSTSTAQAAQSDSSNTASTLSEMQKSLLNRIMAAYSSTTAATGTTTNLSA